MQTDFIGKLIFHKIRIPLPSCNSCPIFWLKKMQKFVGVDGGPGSHSQGVKYKD